MAKKKNNHWYDRESLEQGARVLCLHLKRWTSNASSWVWSAPETYAIPWKALKFALLTLPTIVLAYVTTDIEGLKFPFHQEVMSFIQKYPWSPLLLIAGPGICAFFLDIFESRCAKKSALIEIDQDEFFVILRSIEEIVGKKRHVTAQIASAVLEQNKSRGEVFFQLAKPHDQITEIVARLYLCFRQITGDAALKVGLVKIENGIPVANGAIFQPITSQPSREMYAPTNAKKTLFAHVANEKTTHVIADLEAYYVKNAGNRRCYFFMNDQIDKGSIMCIPIVDPNGGNVAYALSLLSETPNLFGKKSQKKMQTIADYFTARIVMEYLVGMVLANTSPDEIEHSNQSGRSHSGQHTACP